MKLKLWATSSRVLSLALDYRQLKSVTYPDPKQQNLPYIIAGSPSSEFEIPFMGVDPVEALKPRQPPGASGLHSLGKSRACPLES